MTNREDIQNKVLELSNKYNNILLTWATGVGKSFAAINLQQYLKAKKTFIVVGEISHIKNWEDEYKKHNKDISTTNIFCYASLKKNIDEEVDLLILDEGHHSTSEIRLDYLKTIKAKHVIVLSATLEEEKKQSLINVFGKFYEFHISFSDAVKWKIIPEPTFLIFPMKLNKEVQSEIVEFGRGKKTQYIECNYESRWNYIKDKNKYKDLLLKIKCTPHQKYLYISEKYEYAKRQYMKYRREFDKNNWLQLGVQRKRFLAECKTSLLKEVLKLIKNKRYICFCGSIEQAEELSNNTIHSKVKEPLKILERFNNKEINSIFVVNMLQEGQNLVDIEIGLITQLDGKEIAFIQKTGRAIRGKEPIIILFYYKNTRDEEYFQSIQEHIKNYQVITNLTDLKL